VPPSYRLRKTHKVFLQDLSVKLRSPRLSFKPPGALASRAAYSIKSALDTG